MLSSTALPRIRRSIVSSRSSSTDLICKSPPCSLSSSNAISLESTQQPTTLLQHSHIIPSRSSYYIHDSSGSIQARYIHSQQHLATPQLLQTINYDTQNCLSIRQFATTKSSDTDEDNDTTTKT